MGHLGPRWGSRGVGQSPHLRLLRRRDRTPTLACVVEGRAPVSRRCRLAGGGTSATHKPKCQIKQNGKTKRNVKIKRIKA